MTTDAKLAFEEMFRRATLDYRFGVDGPLNKPVTYVAAENGLFEVRTNAVGTFARKIDGVPGMGRVAEGFFAAVPKIPWDLFEKMIEFFRAVMARHGGAEAYIQFFFNRDEGQYFAHVPKQYVSGGHVSFERDAALEAQHILVLEAHSHNSMGAFFSGTDNSDEKGDRLFMVVGRLDRRIPQVLVRYGIAGHHGDLTVEDVFEAPADTTNELWLSQVEKEAPRPKAVENDDDGWWNRPVAVEEAREVLAMMATPSNGHEVQEVLFDERGIAVRPAESDQGALQDPDSGSAGPGSAV